MENNQPLRATLCVPSHCRYLSRNPNQDRNSPLGLEGTHRRFVAFNGAVGDTQLAWLRQALEAARMCVCVCVCLCVCVSVCVGVGVGVGGASFYVVALVVTTLGPL
jgi:hypothetical protein